MIKAVQVCLTDQADQDLEIFDAVLEAALNFVCYKGGERIASMTLENYEIVNPNRATFNDPICLCSFFGREWDRLLPVPS